MICNKKILDLGCGPNKIPGAIGVDLRPGPNVDVVHDLDIYPWPFKDNEFDLICASHIMEHLEDVVRAVEEIHRITRPGGVAQVLVPHFSCSDFFTDPTHKHAFSSRSFDYFVEGTHLRTFNYSPVQFKKLQVQLVLPTRYPFKFILRRLINRYPTIYEMQFAFILPANVIIFELEIVK
ncbi:class I SAM-dependent methyltransferase [Pelotomaculum propionicicum]|uniref:Ubiquinone/menaquinone biosynthesis C-methyltransferase UbiE n=1 Tax=Pelotomaculum propionicicum TaxID=258475 RepID=A0A4Y7RCJ1_9FIRM|nr:class I SAM-dependent methyltransferase [Pelotomaculum propionicicum]NLI14430.1 class I SAM-dependent methyltransferase [Peptococcaceae bacterium]TEB06451.1 Ubiquinone/menaquinone biosynthesis C-methyltransferase UbiE [Pelotomaculum propionicicum]